MKHFIQLRINLVYYYYYDKFNNIGDFSTYYSGIDNSWDKCRTYRGRYEYSKKPHYETCCGIKEWYYSDETYSNYEAYMMAVIG